MCGRFVLGRRAQEIQDELEAGDWPEIEQFLPGFNIAPSTTTPVVVGEPGRTIRQLRWGLVPYWTRDLNDARGLINARSETLSEKPSFRHLLSRNRCAAIADGYYEWRREGRRKTPYYIHRPDGRLLLMAGLWDVWTSEKGGQLKTFTIVTTPPAEGIAHIHHRMPALLDHEQLDAWVDVTHSPAAEALSLLGPYTGELACHPVSTQVNSVANDSPDLIEPAGEPELF